MADNKYFGSGLVVAAGFDLGAAAPLDNRTVVADMAELQAHIEGNRTYEGMMVYVESEGKMYIIQKPAEGETAPRIEEFGFNQEKFDEGLADTKKDVEDLKTADEGIKGRLDKLEGLVVGGEGEGLSAILGDVADLQAVVGDEEEGLVADVADLGNRADALEAKDEELAGDIESVQGKAQTAQDAAQAAQADATQALTDAATAKSAADAAQADATQALTDAATAKSAADAAQADVNALEEKVTALEEINHDAYVAADEQVLAAAKEHAEGQVAAEKALREAAEEVINGRLDAVEAIEHHEHKNKEVLDGITAEKVQAWDGSEQAAKDYTDEKIGELMGCAEEDLHTLHALSEAIKEHGTEFEGYVSTVNEALGGKVDKVEGSRLVSGGEIADWNAKATVAQVEAAQAAAEKVATDAQADLQGQIDALKGDGEGSVTEQVGAAKEELQEAIEGVQGEAQAAQTAAEGAQADATQALTDAATAQTAAEGAQADATQALTDAATAQTAAEAAQTDATQALTNAATAQQAADDAQADVDALEEVIGAPAVDDKEATGLFAEIAELKAHDVICDTKDAAQDNRISILEEMIGAGGVEGDTSIIEQFSDDIASLKASVGKAAEGETAATGLFADIVALRTRDAQLQGAIDAEAQRADTEEKRIVGLVEALGGRMGNAEEAIGQAQVDIQSLQDTINANAKADGQLKGRMDALEGVVGKAAVEGETAATGLFAEIAALKAKDQAHEAKDAELEAAIGVPEAEGQAATGIYAHIKALHEGVAQTFATIKTEIKEDGKLYTSVAGTELKTVTDVAVMDQDDIDAVLAGILGEEEQPTE